MIFKGGRRFETIHATLAEKAFDESAHPRHPKGSDKGGQFAPAVSTFAVDSPVAQRLGSRGGYGRFVFHTGTGSLLVADDAAEHLDLISEDGGRTDDYVRGSVWHSKKTGWLFSFDFERAGALRYDTLSHRWNLDKALATENIMKVVQKIHDGGFPADSQIEIEASGSPDAQRIVFRLGELTGSLTAKSAHWDFPLLGLLRKAGTYDEAKHPRVPAGSERGGQFAPKGGAASTPKAMGDNEPSAVQAAVRETNSTFVSAFKGDTIALQGYILTPRGNLVSLSIKDRFDMPHERFAQAVVGAGQDSELGDGLIFEMLDDGYVSVSAQREFAANVAIGNRDGLAYLRAAVERSPRYKKYSMQVFGAADYSDDVIDVSYDEFLAALERLYEKW